MSEEKIRWENGEAVGIEDTMEEVFKFPLKYVTRYVYTQDPNSGYQLVNILHGERENDHPDSEEGLP